MHGHTHTHTTHAVHTAQVHIMWYTYQHVVVDVCNLFLVGTENGTKQKQPPRHSRSMGKCRTVGIMHTHTVIRAPAAATHSMGKSAHTGEQ